MADKKFFALSHHRTLWDPAAPDDMTGMLARIWGQSAGIEALLRYHRTAANAFTNTAFWMMALDRPGVQELCDRAVTSRNIAGLLLEHNADPYIFAAAYLTGAALKKGIAQVRFRQQVMDYCTKHGSHRLCTTILRNPVSSDRSFRRDHSHLIRMGDQHVLEACWHAVSPE